jgi:hypothetical protein
MTLKRRAAALKGGTLKALRSGAIQDGSAPRSGAGEGHFAAPCMTLKDPLHSVHTLVFFIDKKIRDRLFLKSISFVPCDSKLLWLVAFEPQRFFTSIYIEKKIIIFFGKRKKLETLFENFEIEIQGPRAHFKHIFSMYRMKWIFKRREGWTLGSGAPKRADSV